MVAGSTELNSMRFEQIFFKSYLSQDCEAGLLECTAGHSYPDLTIITTDSWLSTESHFKSPEILGSPGWLSQLSILLQLEPYSWQCGIWAPHQYLGYRCQVGLGSSALLFLPLPHFRSLNITKQNIKIQKKSRDSILEYKGNEHFSAVKIAWRWEYKILITI